MLAIYYQMLILLPNIFRRICTYIGLENEFHIILPTYSKTDGLAMKTLSLSILWDLKWNHNGHKHFNGVILMGGNASLQTIIMIVNGSS